MQAHWKLGVIHKIGTSVSLDYFSKQAFIQLLAHAQNARLYGTCTIFNATVFLAEATDSAGFLCDPCLYTSEPGTK